MDADKVIAILEGTMNPALQKEAEENLDQMHKIFGFSPLLLQIVMSPEIQMPVRQAGSIYLKNMCTKWWKRDPNDEGTSGIFFIHENDKTSIREHIVEAIIHSPDVIRRQLNVIVYQIVKEDFPERWPGVIDKIVNNLASDQNTWMGALQTLYQLTKNYEYKKAEDRGPLLDAMKIFLPALTQLFQHILDDSSAHSVLLKKQCLKIIFALTQFSLPLSLFDEQTLDAWMKFIHHVIEKSPPEETLSVDESERPELPWWKAKKWALHILMRIFERYGSPGTVTKEYTQFSEFFLRRYAVGATHALLKVLDEKRQQHYVSPRVLQLVLHFLEQGVSHAQTWKVMKGVYEELLKDIIFPLMCFNDEDGELWEDDPYEYVRVKFNAFEDFLSPSSAAQCFLQAACSKRKQVIQKTMAFCHSILVQNGAQTNPRQKDGILHIIGSLSSTLLKRKMFKNQLEPMLVGHVYPEFKSSHGFMRARAVWVVQNLSELKFKNAANLYVASDAVIEMLNGDPDPPVRIGAAFALQSLLYDQDQVEKRCLPHLGAIIQSSLKLVHDTENEDMTTVVQKIICLYNEKVIPYAVEITQALAMTFLKLLSADEENGQADNEEDETADNRTITAMGVLNTIETVLDTMEEQRDITKQLEGIVAPVVGHILKNRVLDYYEEILSLMYSLTCQAISPEMWEALPLIKGVFDDDGFDYFAEMMPVLHNFVTVDTASLLTNPQNVEIIFDMCNRTLKGDAGEDAESHAAKLLEVIILQCRGKIDECIPPFVHAALSRLTKEVKTSELRTMCLQVVVAAIWYNAPLLFQTLESMQFPNTTETVTEQFFRQWIKDSDCFLGIHDRRIAVYGWCTVLDAPQHPAILTEVATDILPSLIMLLQGLTRAYKSRGDDNSSDNSSSDEEDGDSDFDPEELASSEDEVDEESAEYLEMLEKHADDDDESVDLEGETALEIYTSSFDEDDNASEYCVFKDVLSKLESANSEWYHHLISKLTDDQRKEIQEIFVAAEQRRAEAESKKIEKTGGYQFNTTSVPSSFNFGSGSATAFSP